jgi:hypothetical protein
LPGEVQSSQRHIAYYTGKKHTVGETDTSTPPLHQRCGFLLLLMEWNGMPGIMFGASELGDRMELVS